MHLRPFAISLLSAALALTLTGCATSFDPADSAPSIIPGVAISGTSFGGRQPIAGAHVYVLRANTLSYAGPGITPVSGNLSNSLLTTGSGSDSVGEYVLTDANGKFSVSSDYTCTAGDQVYLLSLGGKPDGVNANAAIGLMAVLGTCGTDFTSATTVNMNEVSTIAAAYAFAGFASDATHVGITNSTNALTGLKNAFANAKQIYDISSNPYNTPNTTARTTTPGNGTNGGTGTVPQQQINTLADILAMCINSSGSGSSQCLALFSSDKDRGNVSPSDTATAAIFMAHNQHNNSVYNVAANPPYTPYYNTTPNDLSIQLVFSGGGMVAQYHYDIPQLVAIDALGNVWTVGASTALSKFSPLGVPVSSTGYTSLGLGTSNAISVEVDNDPNYVWVGDGVHNRLVRFNVGTSATTFYNSPSGGSPNGIAFNSSGNLWVTDYNLNSLYPITASTGVLGSQTTGNGLNQPGAPAIADNGNIWVNNPGSVTGMSVFNSSGTAIANSNDSLFMDRPISCAADAGNNGWFVRYQNPNLVKASVSGGTIVSSNYTWAATGAAGTSGPQSLAIDGNGNVWISAHTLASKSSTPLTDNTVIEFNNSGTLLTGLTGFVAAPNTAEPNAIALDGSGNVWYNSSIDGTLHEMLGAATPVDVPLAHAVANNKVGARP
ncbi:MAG: hypothetical protein V4555_09900 [Acidobacteriota bacterium]